MTIIKIFKKTDKIYCVECSGHTGFDEYGKDILCSSISTLVQSAVLGVQEVAKLDNQFKVNEKKGYLYFKILDFEKIKDTESFRASQYILQTMFLSLNDLAQNYKEYIKLEVIEDDYD